VAYFLGCSAYLHNVQVVNYHSKLKKFQGVARTFYRKTISRSRQLLVQTLPAHLQRSVINILYMLYYTFLNSPSRTYFPSHGLRFFSSYSVISLYSNVFSYLCIHHLVLYFTNSPASNVIVPTTSVLGPAGGTSEYHETVAWYVTLNINVEDELLLTVSRGMCLAAAMLANYVDSIFSLTQIFYAWPNSWR